MLLWDGEPTVTLIIAAHNEEKTIKEKLENSLTLDYPKEKLEIIVASDGSTDRTNEIVKCFNDRRIKLHSYERLGKTGIQNESVKIAEGEIIVFSDANAMYKEDAIRKLVRNFSDNNIACVCGHLRYKDNQIKQESLSGVCEGYYWKYEKFLKKRESMLVSSIGANGSIYAIRKKEYVEIDNNLISDLVEPLEVIKKGKRVIYEPEAISEEKPCSSYKSEFNRKVRILTRSLQAILYMKSILNPFKYGFFSIQVLVHKLFRYVVPLFLITGILSLVFLTHIMFYYILFCILVVILTFAIIAKFTENTTGGNIFFNLIYYYLTVNYALLLAWIKVLKKEKITTWTTDRI